MVAIRQRERVKVMRFTLKNTILLSDLIQKLIQKN
jgi:hypothetical protein